MIQIFKILLFSIIVSNISIAQIAKQYLTTYWIESYYHKNLSLLVEILSDSNYYPIDIKYTNNFPNIPIKRKDLVMISLFVDGKQITPYHLTGISIQPPLGPGCAWAEVYPDTTEKRYKFTIENLSKNSFFYKDYFGKFYFILQLKYIKSNNKKIKFKNIYNFKILKFMPNYTEYILSFRIVP